jgi:hypothetical protein
VTIKLYAFTCDVVPWRYHRSLVADALSVRGGLEMLSESSYRMA